MPGDAIVLEEASFLGALFSHLLDASQIPSFLQAYEDIRQPRAERIHKLEDDNITILSLPPGPARTARNDTWKEQKKTMIARNIGQQGKGVSEGSEYSEEEERELRRQWQELFEVWGYDGRDAAEGWWVEWGLLRERSLSVNDGQGTHHSNVMAGGVGDFGVQQVEVTIAHN